MRAVLATIVVNILPVGLGAFIGWAIDRKHKSEIDE